LLAVVTEAVLRLLLNILLPQGVVVAAVAEATLVAVVALVASKQLQAMQSRLDRQSLLRLVVAVLG
jgi:hypothetical protein